MKQFKTSYIILIAAIIVAAIAIVYARVNGPGSAPTTLKQSGSTSGEVGWTLGSVMPVDVGMDMREAAMDEMMEETEMKTAASPIPPAQGGSAATDLDGNEITPRVIKTGELKLRVEDASKAMEDVRTLVTSKDGFVESSSVTDSGEGPRTAYMTLRVPVSSFDSVIEELKGVATLVLRESTGGQDVTSEFVDLEADLRNARAEETSYLAILNRSGSIEEVLMVTRQLADVRGRIERLEGRKRYMENRTDLATIALTLTEETRVEAPTDKWEPAEVVRQSIRGLVLGLQAFVDFLIRFVISVIGLLIPVAAFTALLIWLGWKLVRWVMKKMKK